MTDWNSAFDLCFEYNRQQFEVKTKFVRLGFIHQFHVSLKEQTLIVEFDEERKYRVIDASQSGQLPEEGLLKTIVNEISRLHSRAVG